FARQLVIGARGACPIHEEHHGLGLGDALVIFEIRKGKRIESQADLAGKAQPLPTRDDEYRFEGHLPPGQERLVTEGDQVLEVVEDEQRRSLPGNGVTEPGHQVGVRLAVERDPELPAYLGADTGNAIRLAQVEDTSGAEVLAMLLQVLPSEARLAGARSSG